MMNIYMVNRNGLGSNLEKMNVNFTLVADTVH